MRDEIDLGADSFLDINPEDLNYGAGDCRSMGDFMAKYPYELNHRRLKSAGSNDRLKPTKDGGNASILILCKESAVPTYNKQDFVWFKG